MKTILVSCFLFLASVSAFAQDITLDEVRKKYPIATKDEAVCNELFAALSGKGENKDLMCGYTGCVTMLKAKYCVNPFSKLEYYKDGKQMLEDAIAQNKNNIELRFLRLAIQENLPAMLGYNENIEEDMNYILKYLPILELRELRKAIATYLIKSERTDEKQKASLRKFEN